MAHWNEVFDDDICEFKYEDFVADPETKTRELLHNVNLEFAEECLDFQSAKGNVMTSSVYQVRQKVYTSSVDVWKHYEKHLGVLLNGLENGPL